MLVRGMSANDIARDLGISLTTAKRRVAELKGKVPAEKTARLAAAKAAPPSAPSPPSDDVPISEEEIPAGATVEQIDKWLKVAEEKANNASALEDPDAHLSYLRIVLALIEARRKATPIPKPDPNDNPDMVEAAALVRERWHNLAENLSRVSKSPIAETIARMLREARESTDGKKERG